MCLKINWSVKTPWHWPSMGVLCVSGSQLMKHPTLKTQQHTTGPRNGPIVPFWSWKWLKQGMGGGIYCVQISKSHCAHLTEEKESWGLILPLGTKTSYVGNRKGQIIQFWCFISKKWRLIKINQILAFCHLPDQKKNSCNLGRGWGRGLMANPKKKLAASEMIKASAKGQEEVVS